MKVKAILDKFSRLQAQAIPTTTKIRKALEKGKSVEINDVLANKLIGWNIVKKVTNKIKKKKEGDKYWLLTQVLIPQSNFHL